MTESLPTVTVATVPVLPPVPLRQRLMDWSKQPSTLQGLSLLMASGVLAWMRPFPGAEGIAATLLAGSLPKLWPDNTTDALKTRDLANAIAHAAVTRRPADLERAAEQVAADIVATGVTKP